MPARRAASRLPPIANVRRPKIVRLSTNQPSGHDDAEDHDQQRDAEHVLAGDVLDGLLAHDLRAVVGHLRGQPAGAHQHRQRHDERHQPAVGDEQSVDQPRAGADQKSAQDHHHRAVVLGRHGRRPDRREGDERTDGQVDAAADDHERHADGHDTDDRRADQDVADVVAGQEVVAGDGCR